MLMFFLQLASAMVLGRAFCGWICPAGGLQEIESSFAGKPFKFGKHTLLKWAIWIPWITSIATGAVLAGGIDAFDFFFQTEQGLSVASIHGLLIYLGIIALFFIPNLFAGRRGMCHCICWMAPFMITGEKLGQLLHLPQLHISSQPESCIDCNRCNKVCPMSLPVQDLMKSGPITHTECIQCGACCDVCPKQALELKIEIIGTAKK
jgi:ferredoxin-type protein NapH